MRGLLSGLRITHFCVSKNNGTFGHAEEPSSWTIEMTIETLVIEIKKDFDAAARLRASRAMEMLVAKIKEAYARGSGKTPEGVPMSFTASHGAAGALGGITWEVKQAETFVEATIGLADSARYLRNLEFGESGTSGSPAGGALFQRSLAPPVKNIYAWLLLSKIETPDWFKERAEAMKLLANSGHKHPVFDANKDKPWYSQDAQMQFAYYIAMKRKRLGRPAMRVIQRTAEAHTEKIRDYLSGTTS